jgi:hypothetical protein
MEAQLVSKEYRFDALVETIVSSPQFVNKRMAVAPEATMAQLQSRKGK